jgi:arginyl-tRNA synthetase
MKFKIEKEVFKKFPNFVVAIPVILDFDNSKSEKEALDFLREEEKNLRSRFTLDSFFADPRVTSYREAFRQFGIDPEKRIPAHVALSKRVLEGGELPNINPMVNLYNAMSIKHTTPFGGEDLETLYGDFVLKFAEGGEKWIPIGGGKAKSVIKDDLVWGDDLDISTPSLNWRQCDRTKLVRESKDGYFIMDGFFDINKDIIEKALEDFIRIATKLFGGKAETYWLDIDHPEADVPFETKDVKSVIKQIEHPKKEVFNKNYFGVQKIIADSLTKITGEKIINLDVPENMEFGDYSTNVAMTLFAKIQTSKNRSQVNSKLPRTDYKSPRELAEEIVTKIENCKLEIVNYVDKVKVAGPGFINFYLKKDVLIDTLLCISSQKFTDRYSHYLQGQKISVEYTDPNPFKEFHIGHLYSNLIGESIATILEAAGAKVWRADFYGDVGMHVAKSVWGIMQKMDAENVSLQDMEKMSVKDRQNFMGQGYALGTIRYDEDEAVKEQIKDINYMVYVASQEVLEKEHNWKPLVNYKKFIEGKMDLFEKIKPVYQKGLKWSLEYFETYYSRLGTKFDGYYPESWVGEYGVKFVEEGIEKGILEKSEGAVVFKGEKYGLHTRVFLNKFGLPTYEAKDLGLAKAKYEDFKYDRSLNIFGKEIDEYYDVVAKAMQLINPELGNKAEHLAHGMVNLPEGKMSSRKGNVITVEWLLNEAKNKVLELIDNSELDDTEKDSVAEMVGQGAIKFALLKSNIGNNVTFDFNESIRFEGNSGPYLQYTYARCQSVVRKAEITNDKLQMTNKMEVGKLKMEINDEESNLLRSFTHFPEVVAEAADKYAPNLICKYLYDLAQKYNGFYARHKIIENVIGGKLKVDGNKDISLLTEHNLLNTTQVFRLELTSATGTILKEGLGLLGIQAPQRM